MCIELPAVHLRSHARQVGQALVEAVLGLALLSTCVLLIILLGKYQSIAQTSVMVSRELAFECAIRGIACKAGPLSTEAHLRIRRAHFENDAPEGARQLQPALWHDRAGRAMLSPEQDFHADIHLARFDAGLGLASSSRSAGVSNPLAVVTDLAGPRRFGLSIDDGIRIATVRLQTQRASPVGLFDAQLMGTALSFVASTAAMADDWNASGPDDDTEFSVHSRVRLGRRLNAAPELGLRTAYKPAIALLRLADAIGIEADSSEFDREHLDVDIVPPDRIQP